jgi:hypothetical protein
MLLRLTIYRDENGKPNQCADKKHVHPKSQETDEPGCRHGSLIDWIKRSATPKEQRAERPSRPEASESRRDLHPRVEPSSLKAFSI